MPDVLSERVMVRLTPATRNALEARAQKVHRRISDYIRLLIEQDLASNNGKPAPEIESESRPA